jgi:hypothetical protein
LFLYNRVMKILLTRLNDKYGFSVLSRSNQPIYVSSRHYFLTPFVKSDYKYAWEACRDAWKLALKHPYHIASLRFARYDLEDPIRVDVSADEMITTHYLTILRDLRIKIKGIGADKENRRKVYKEAKMVIKEIETIQAKIEDPKEKRKLSQILQQFHSLIRKYMSREKKEDPKEVAPIKMASIVNPKTIDIEIKRELLEDYAQRACQAIEHKHNDCYYSINADRGEISLVDFKNEPMIKMEVDENLCVSSIVSVNKLYASHPVHSLSFYQAYWKPIAEGIGHFQLTNSDILLKIDSMTLPDAPKNTKRYTVAGWNCKEMKPDVIDLSFKGEKPIWVFEPTQNIKVASVNRTQEVSKYTEQDYLNAAVKCIDKNLESIFGKMGAVVQIMPSEDMIEVDVDFGKDLGVVRLTESQVKIVTAPS